MNCRHWVLASQCNNTKICSEMCMVAGTPIQYQQGRLVIHTYALQRLQKDAVKTPFMTTWQLLNTTMNIISWSGVKCYYFIENWRYHTGSALYELTYCHLVGCRSFTEKTQAGSRQILMGHLTFWNCCSQSLVYSIADKKAGHTAGDLWNGIRSECFKRMTSVFDFFMRGISWNCGYMNCVLHSDFKQPTMKRCNKINLDPVSVQVWGIDSIYKVKPVMRPSHLHNGNLYNGKTVSQCWDGPSLMIHIYIYSHKQKGYKYII